MTDLNIKIKKARENRNYTQEYMASSLGISQSAYAQLEKGSISINISRLKKIANILEFDINKLISSDDLILDIHHNTLNDNASIINQLNNKQNELYERIIEEKENTIKRLEEIITKLKKVLC